MSPRPASNAILMISFFQPDTGGSEGAVFGSVLPSRCFEKAIQRKISTWVLFGCGGGGQNCWKVCGNW